MRRVIHWLPSVLVGAGVVLVCLGIALAPAGALATRTTSGCSPTTCTKKGQDCSGGCSGLAQCGCNNAITPDCNCNRPVP